MPQAAIDELAEAIRDALNDADFSIAFTAIRARKAKRRVEELKTLVVAVIPAGTVIDTDESTRGKMAEQHRIDVAIQKKLASPDDLVEGDALSYLAQEIRDFLCRTSLSEPVANCMEIATVDGAEAGYSPQHLDEFGVFTGVVRSTWLMWRAA